MLAGEARDAALHWVRQNTPPGFRGAFLAGSAADRPADAVQPPWSDVDVTVVVAGAAAPPKPGKIRHRGALLDVSYLPEALLADPERVAAAHYLAPSFAGPGGVLLDPEGVLGRLRAAIAPTYDSPSAVHRRVADVLTAVRMRLTARDDAAPWPQQVLAWLFPATLVTVAALVAARERPTVRLRFLRARDVLRDRPDVYERMLELLGCAAVDAAVVARHLDRLGDVFDEAAAVGSTRFSFSSDISPEARPVAIDGSRALVDAGDHREAVFWIVATFARCQQILDVEAAPERSLATARAFRVAVAELTGVHGPDDLRTRTAATLAFLPELEGATTAITGRTR
ncbi:hypothetical protein FHX44_115810 [Pseudonocardia hierapolitana]|uniref:Uncharacterized protein n=1 Tax=Pseudonocardia hierapolitana TaxID=1128676 RepID=A0A561SYC9_9PSEU|nr:hypothetical protein [Pseudonocardia hierapolitana]TWF79874.1 hypothetical protein FHX44_115810 [Pseudonocardia hierapolitana]